jgi:hypothetical protein
MARLTASGRSAMGEWPALMPQPTLAHRGHEETPTGSSASSCLLIFAAADSHVSVPPGLTIALDIPMLAPLHRGCEIVPQGGQLRTPKVKQRGQGEPIPAPHPSLEVTNV